MVQWIDILILDTCSLVEWFFIRSSLWSSQMEKWSFYGIYSNIYSRNWALIRILLL